MKDKHNPASTAAEHHSHTHGHNAVHPTTVAPHKGPASGHAKQSVDENKLNRRYSFDDNGGGYLGL